MLNSLCQRTWEGAGSIILPTYIFEVYPVYIASHELSPSPDFLTRPYLSFITPMAPEGFSLLLLPIFQLIEQFQGTEFIYGFGLSCWLLAVFLLRTSLFVFCKRVYSIWRPAFSVSGAAASAQRAYLLPYYLHSVSFSFMLADRRHPFVDYSLDLL
jgi:hypothetical protein